MGESVQSLLTSILRYVFGRQHKFLKCLKQRATGVAAFRKFGCIRWQSVFSFLLPCSPLWFPRLTSLLFYPAHQSFHRELGSGPRALSEWAERQKVRRIRSLTCNRGVDANMMPQARLICCGVRQSIWNVKCRGG